MLRPLSLTLAVALTSACSPFPPSDTLEGPTCTSSTTLGGRWSPSEAIRASLGADFVIVCAAIGDSMWSAESGSWSCDGRVDREGCLDAVGACFFGGGLVVATGDEVVYRGGAELVAFLAPIETVDEALIMALVAGYRWPECGDLARTGGRRVEGGWEVVVPGDIECTGQVGPYEIREVFYRHLVRVDDDGTVTELAREASHEGSCYDFCECGP